MYAYCLIPNHLHFLIEMRGDSISRIMQRVLTTQELLKAAGKTSGLKREERCSNRKTRKTVAVKEAVIVLGRRSGIPTGSWQRRWGWTRQQSLDGLMLLEREGTRTLNLASLTRALSRKG